MSDERQLTEPESEVLKAHKKGETFGPESHEARILEALDAEGLVDQKGKSGSKGKSE